MTAKPLKFPDRGLLFDDLTPVDRLAAGPWAQQVAEALRTGVCPVDGAFDRFLPHDLRLVSSRYWTPLAVAVRVADWLDDLGIRTMVDIGSGAGKFCVAAALAGHCRFTGLEQRPRLVAAARVLARLFEVEDRVGFIEGTFGEIPLPPADAYYLYNPFDENLFGANEHLGEYAGFGEERYERDIENVERLLQTASVGTYVLTYNGFGGRVPDSYDEIRADHELRNVLRMWRKERAKSIRSNSVGMK